MSVNQQRIQNLQTYINLLSGGKAGGPQARDLYMRYQQDLLSVTPQEAFEIFSSRFSSGEKAGDILIYLDKVINVLHKGLAAWQWQKPSPDSFLGLLRSENDGLVSRLDSISEMIRSARMTELRSQLRHQLQQLTIFEDHYLKKENILFPYMEKKHDRFNGVAIMWSLHDEARKCLKDTLKLLEKQAEDEQAEIELSVSVGKLFFSLHGLVQKEELILFPAASEIFSDAEFKDMLRQSYDYSFPFIEPENIPEPVDHDKSLDSSAAFPKQTAFPEALFLQAETGSLTLEQIMMIFAALPVDISFVDEHNKLRYFTRPEDRIFPRSPAAIGRDVKNCHPPESVHVVEEIIESFRSGRQSKASFWIELKGRFILIMYFALRDQNNIYKGVVEVSQDVTDIRSLNGQRRLLQWDD